jgi:hypothetical protein
MLDLMVMSRDDRPMPLYLHAVYRILREMRIELQEAESAYSYVEFKTRISQNEMMAAQVGWRTSCQIHKQG